MGFLSWLAGGNDRQLAETTYSSRESATDRVARKRREGRRKGVARAARQGQAWEERDRRRFR